MYTLAPLKRPTMKNSRVFFLLFLVVFVSSCATTVNTQREPVVLNKFEKNKISPNTNVVMAPDSIALVSYKGHQSKQLR